MLTKKSISFGFILSGSWKNLVYVIIATTLAYLIDRYLLYTFVDTPTLIPAILGTALAFFIGFNNNQAYDRWWEGRKIWGMLVNDSRSMARQWLKYADPSNREPAIEMLRESVIHRQIAFVYALKEALRNTPNKKYRNYMLESEIGLVENETNIPNAILSLQSRDLEFAYSSGILDGFKFMEINRTINSLCDEMGKAERIKNTVFPTTYNYYTRIFVFIFVIFEVWGTAGSIGLWSIVTGSLIGYIFLTTQAIGLALLNPFEATAAGLPLDQITRTIEINLKEMEGATDVPLPYVQKDQEFVT
jgi:putative membrane protein